MIATDTLDGFNINPAALHLLNSRPDLKVKITVMIEAKDKAAKDAWRAGGGTVGQSTHDWPVMLRVSGDDMQTSKGARVPLADAKWAYHLAMRLRASLSPGTTPQLPSPLENKVGMYRLDSVNDNGIVAGCHRISWTEVDRFAALMGWVA